MRRDNRDAVRAQFGAHAAGYATSAGHAGGSDLGLLIDHLPKGSTLTALDVATGTGHTAMALAPHVASVVGLDLTPQMLAEAERLAGARGLPNLTWRQGDAHALPYPDGAFDIVTVRRAAHHFADVARFLREAHRVLKPDGTLGVVDQSVPDVAEAAELIERMEKLRDPSHVRAWSPAGWRRLLAAASFQPDFVEVTLERRDVDEWLELAGSGADGERVRILAPLASASQAALRGNGFQHDGDGRHWFDKLRVVIVARAL